MRLLLKEWRDAEWLVIGGGFRASWIGELAIGRTAVLLKAERVKVELQPVATIPTTPACSVPPTCCRGGC